MNESIHSINLSRARILVVDDYPSTAATMARALAQLGPTIEVLSATSGKAALDLVRDGAVDLLITDMMMPEMNGLELIERLKAHPGGHPSFTILVTAYDVPGLRESARRLKVNEIVIKPFRPERIFEIARKALESMADPNWSSQSTPTQQPFKILIADDIEDNVSLLSRYLQNEGYAFVAVRNGIEALEKTRSEMPDLILLDINMPGKDGFEVLREIRADPMTEHLPVIMLTAARVEPADMRAGLNLGADDYVTKPFDRRELLARIRTKLRAKEVEEVVRRRNKELSVIPEIGRDFSGRLDINELTDVVLRRVVETLGAKSARIIILNSQKSLDKEYGLLATDDSTPSMHLPPLNDLLEQVKQSRQSMIIEDTHRDSRWQVMPDDPAGSLIIAPLVGRLELIGFIVLIHEQSGYFVSEHQTLLEAIASQASIAIENAQLHAKLDRGSEKQAVAFENSPDAILFFDANGCLEFSNPAGKALLEKDNLVVGQPLSRGAGFDSLIELLDETLASMKSGTGEIVWPDGRAFTMLISPLEQDGCLVLLHDVSYFKDLERIRTEYLLGASHDLKDPITLMTLYSQLLAKVGPLNEKQVEITDQIRATADKMNGLVQQLMAQEEADLQPDTPVEMVDMNVLTAEVVMEFQPLADAKEQRLVFDKGRGRPFVRGNLYQIRRALSNLVGNAIKYTPISGSIDVWMETENEEVSLHVKDTGHGIPAADLPFIHDRTHRVRNRKVEDSGSSGLGLAIVKSIAERYNGKVYITSEPGKGSCFTLTLPLVETGQDPVRPPVMITESKADP